MNPRTFFNNINFQESYSLFFLKYASDDDQVDPVEAGSHQDERRRITCFRFITFLVIKKKICYVFYSQLLYEEFGDVHK